MFRIIIKQFMANWNVIIGIFLALFLSTILLASFSLLLINSIYAIVLGPLSGIKVPEQPIAIFGSLVGIIFFLGLFSIYSTINLAVRLRWKQFILLRILGCTHRKIKLIIFFETLVIAIVTIGTSLVVSIPFSNVIIDFLQNGGGLDKAFHLYKNFQYQWIYILATIFIVILITYFATLQIKKIEISSIDNFYQKVVWYKSIIRVSLGIVSFLGAIALTVIPELMVSGLGEGMVLCAIFCYIIAFGLLGKYLIGAIVFMFQFVGRYYLIRVASKSILDNIEKIFFPIALLVSLSLFVNYTITIPNLLKIDNSANIRIISLLAIIISVFNSIIALNDICQYFLEKKQEFKTLRILGYCKKTVVSACLIEGTIISSIAFLFSVVLTIYFNLQFSSHNGLNNVYSSNLVEFWIINGAIFVGSILVTLLPVCFLLKK
ncbi:FtsX-like permease family protein [Spiroplasma sp. AdecLV25b]|uniref:FtsX-like permease family protein n=1 Tax=Spiroplasma sp. AdecLV25b TaxID=3027162 RepID=UPI0027E16546|nr:FtsX-like permease family protein [Spiroplasma sp. AdecLV25b]